MHSARLIITLALAAATACRPANDTAPIPATPPRAPWRENAIASSAVPPVYLSEWRAAENRATCTLIAPSRLGSDVASSQPRAATFSGGWAVAYDLPGERSAFGVAGTGASAWSGTIYDDWPYKRQYADGSRVGYGTEGGGAGPKWLAYVRIPGQDCLYNVWSLRGREHLEALLTELRFVASP